MSDHAIAVVAHPWRRAHAEGLAEEIAAESICWDETDLGASRNHLRAWEWLAESDGDWKVAVEDDALPVWGFTDQLAQVLAAAPADVVSLYLGRGTPPHWQPSIAVAIWPGGGLPGAPDPHFLTCGYLLSAVGYALRAPLVPDMLRFLRDCLRKSPGLPIDEAISRWTRRRRHTVAYCRPSLLNHRDGPPLIQGRVDGKPRDQRRTAWLFDTREQWLPTAAEIPRPRVRRGRVVGFPTYSGATVKA